MLTTPNFTFFDFYVLHFFIYRSYLISFYFNHDCYFAITCLIQDGVGLPPRGYDVLLGRVCGLHYRLKPQKT